MHGIATTPDPPYVAVIFTSLRTEGDQVIAAERRADTTEYRIDSPLVRRSDAFRDYAAASFPKGRSVMDAVLDLTHRIHEEFRFDSTATEVHTPSVTVRSSV